MAPKTATRITCPECGELVLVNIDGRIRVHPQGRGVDRCEMSWERWEPGKVQVKKLADGVVIKVEHPPDTIEPREDELVMLTEEWAELVAIARTKGVH